MRLFTALYGSSTVIKVAMVDKFLLIANHYDSLAFAKAAMATKKNIIK